MGASLVYWVRIWSPDREGWFGCVIQPIKTQVGEHSQGIQIVEMSHDREEECHPVVLKVTEVEVDPEGQPGSDLAMDLI